MQVVAHTTPERWQTTLNAPNGKKKQPIKQQMQCWLLHKILMQIQGFQNFLQCNSEFKSSSCQLVDGHQVQKNKPNNQKT